MVASVLELQNRSQKEQAVKDAFASAVARVHVIANAHDHLLPKEGQSLIDMREYLTVLLPKLRRCSSQSTQWRLPFRREVRFAWQ
jgi:two-component sensor histidine kinase